MKKTFFEPLARFKRMTALTAGLVMLAIGVAYAAQTSVSSITPLGPYISGQPGANALNFTFTACDTSNGNKFSLTGRDILLVENTGMSAYTFTVTSAPDSLGRTNDITAYSVAAGDFSAFNLRGDISGWRQTDGSIHLACSNAAIEFAPITTSN